MPIITLTTDLGNVDHYVAKVKGKLLSLNPQHTIVDISHQVKPYNIIEAAFLLKNSFKSFPKGSIHLVSVLTASYSDNSPSTETPNHIAFKYKDHYFIGPNNGIFPMLYNEKPEEIVLLEIEEIDDHQSFSVGNLYARAADFLAKGGILKMLGSQIDEVYEKNRLQPTYSESYVQGAVVHIDHFGNLITNIKKAEFSTAARNRDFEIELGFNHSVYEICQWYGEVSQGDIIALFNADGFLEIAINQGNAHNLLGIKLHDNIRISIHAY